MKLFIRVVTFYIDMDGTIWVCEITQMCRGYIATWTALQPTSSVEWSKQISPPQNSSWSLDRTSICTQLLDAVDGIQELMDLGFFVMMLTKTPSENPYSAAEKIIWIYKHIPKMEDHIIIAPDKGCVGTFHDFLIDDHPEWANAHNFAGTVVKFGGEHDPVHSHIHGPDWPAIVKYFAENRDRIFKRYDKATR